MSIERLWNVRCALDPKDAIINKEGLFIIINKNKMKKIHNPEYEFSVWATTRNKALKKALKQGANITEGLVSVKVSDTHLNTRPIKQK